MVVVGWCLVVDLVFGLEVITDALLSLVDFFPRCGGVGQVQEPGLEDELFVLREGHLGVLCGGEGGELGADPAEVALGGAVHEGGHEGGVGDALLGDFLRVDAGEGFGVDIGPEADADIDGLDGVHVDGVEEVELVVGGVLEEEVGQGIASGLPEGVSAGEEDGLEGCLDEGHGDGV